MIERDESCEERRRDIRDQREEIYFFLKVYLYVSKGFRVSLGIVR